MFLLDTNVLSALMQPEVPAAIGWWRRAHPGERVAATAAICAAEILAGIRKLPAGRRRSALEQAAEALFATEFAGLVLPFDLAAAEAYGDMYGDRMRAGRRRPRVDLMIAAIARVHGATIVTRNERDFDGCGVAVVNPWSA